MINEAALHDNVTLHFSEKCIRVDVKTPSVTFRNTETGKETTVIADLVVGKSEVLSCSINFYVLALFFLVISEEQSVVHVAQVRMVHIRLSASK